MQQLNLIHSGPIPAAYALGLLPQRNQKGLYYQDSSCRSNLTKFQLSSENRRILRKTDQYSHRLIPLSEFDFNIGVQKNCYQWAKSQGWDFPGSSIKTIFTSHIFNHVYLWREGDEVIAYGLCYLDDSICHIAYVFYHPRLSHGNLPIRLVLQAVIDSHDRGLEYCYLGRFSPTIGYYKRNMPGFEYYQNGQWIGYN